SLLPCSKRLPAHQASLLLGVCGRARELDADEGLVTDDLGIVARRNRVGVAPFDGRLLPVDGPHLELTGDAVADVVLLAVVGAGNGLHRSRPRPAGFETEPADAEIAQVVDLDLGVIRLA